MCVSFCRSKPYPFSTSARMSKNVEVPTIAAILRPLRSSTRAMPASLRATTAPRTAVATPVTLSGTPSSNALAASAKLMSIASTFFEASWFSSGAGEPGTIEYSACQPRLPSRSSLWMISVAAQPSCRYARRTLPLPCARRATGPLTAATVAAAAPPFRNSRRPTLIVALLLGPDLGQVLEGLRDLLGRVLVVLELAREVGLVGREIQEAVPAQVEDDRLAFALLLGAEGLVDRAADRVGRLRRGQDALGARELDGRLEGGDLGHRDGLDHLLVVELADERRHAVIAQPARVERGRDEPVAERVHLHERREADRVAEVVHVLALGEARAGAGLDGDHAELLLLAGELVGDEGEGEAREVRAPADAADEHVGLVVGLLELLAGLEPDHGLVHQDVVEHAPERVLGVVPRRRVLDRLADRDAEAAGRVRVALEDLLARLRVRARARDHLRAVRLHQHAAVGLLVVGDLHHVDLALQPEHVARDRERRAPLAGAGLGRQPRHAGLLVVVGLRDGRVGLVAAGRAHALVLVVDARRRAERLLEPPRAVERRRPPQAVEGAHGLGDLDPALLADLLLDQLHREQRRQVLGPDRLAGAGVQRRRQGGLEVGLDVVPLRRDVLLVEQELGAVLVGRLRHTGLLGDRCGGPW